MQDNLEWLVRVEQKISDVLEQARNYGNPEYQRPVYSVSKWFDLESDAREYMVMSMTAGYTAYCYHIDDIPDSTRNTVRRVMKANSL